MNKLRGVRSRVARPTGAASARADADARAAAGASVRRRIDTDLGNLADLPDKRGSPPIHRAAGANGGARASPPITRLLCRSYGQTWRELREARSLAAARRSDVVAGVTPGPLAGRSRRSPSPPPSPPPTGREGDDRGRRVPTHAHFGQTRDMSYWRRSHSNTSHGTLYASNTLQNSAIALARIVAFCEASRDLSCSSSSIATRFKCVVRVIGPCLAARFLTRIGPYSITRCGPPPP